MVSREHILDEIKRTAELNDGVALGQKRFSSETGIKADDWRGRYWANWSQALKEAGYEPREWQGAHDDAYLLDRLAALARELGHYPTRAEMMLKARDDETFPSYQTYARRGRKAELAAKLAEFATGRGDHDIVAICAPIARAASTKAQEPERGDEVEFGFVYMLKSGRFYKIGRTNAVGRRERELAIQLPEKATVVHEIRTDDPVGIEQYWHRRFQARRKNGEWFELTRADVTAFRRRKFM